MRQYRKTVRHFNEPGHAHFLTFSCYNSFPLLNRERSRKWFTESILQAKSQPKFALWAYVVMPDHAHLIVYPLTAEYDIALFLKSTKQSAARKAKHYLQKNNGVWLKKLTTARGNREVFRFWQAGPGYDRNIKSDDELFEKIDYIHTNPFRKGLVADPQDWKWSSARWFAGARDVPLQMDEINLSAKTRTN